MEELAGPRDLLTYFSVFKDRSDKNKTGDNVAFLMLGDEKTDEEPESEQGNQKVVKLLEEMRTDMRKMKEENKQTQKGLEETIKALSTQLEKEKRMREEEELKRLRLQEESNQLQNKLFDKTAELQEITKELANVKRETLSLQPKQRDQPLLLKKRALPKLLYKFIADKTPPSVQLYPLTSSSANDDELMSFLKKKLARYGTVKLQNQVVPQDWEDGVHLAQLVHLVDPTRINVNNLDKKSSRILVTEALDNAKEILGAKFPERLNTKDVITGEVEPAVLRQFLSEMRKKIDDAELIRWMNAHPRVQLSSKTELVKKDFANGEVLAFTVSRVSTLNPEKLTGSAQEKIADVLRVVRSECKIEHNCDPSSVRRGEEKKSNLRKMLLELKRKDDTNELKRWVNEKLKNYNESVDDVLDADEYKDGNKYCHLVNAIDPNVIKKDVSMDDFQTRIKLALDACKRDFKLPVELDPSDVALANVDRDDEFDFLTELKEYDDAHADPLDSNRNLDEFVNPLEKALQLTQPPPTIKLIEDPPRASKKSYGGARSFSGDENMVEVISILQTEHDKTAEQLKKALQRIAELEEMLKSAGPRRSKDQQIWEIQLRELYYRKGRRTNFSTLTDVHEDNKFLEQRYRDFKSELNALHNHLTELMAGDRVGKPEPELVEQYQEKLIKFKEELKESKAAWVKAENKLGSVYEPKTEKEVYFEQMRLKLLRVIDFPEKYLEDPERLHVLQGKVAQLNKELFKDNELWETLKILNKNRRVARHHLEDLLEEKRKLITKGYFESEIERLFAIIDDLDSGVSGKERRAHRAAIVRMLIENFEEVFENLPVNYKDISQLVSEPAKHIEKRFITTPGLYSKTNYMADQVSQIISYSNNGYKLELKEVNDPYVLAQVVKTYFNELGNLILSSNFNELDVKDRVSFVKKARSFVKALPVVRRSTVAFIFAHFASLGSHANHSKMTAKAIGKIFAPIFIA